MHELALCREILAIVEAEAKARGFTRVRAVRLEVGALACASPEAIAFCFEAISHGTLAAGARLEMDRPAGHGCCLDCGSLIAMSERGDRCPRCGGPALGVRGGDALRVTELEVD